MIKMAYEKLPTTSHPAAAKSLRISPLLITSGQAHSACKGFLWCRFTLFICLLCTIVYIPLFYTVNFREGQQAGTKGPNFQWNVNATRDVAVYVQPENVTARIPNAALCTGANGEKAPFLLVIVCSAVNNTEARNAIRETWMKWKQPNKINQTNSSPTTNGHETPRIEIAFLLGETGNETLQNRVYSESEAHGDIIQEGFYDSYLNLTLKSVMLLKWVTTYCPEVNFVLKTDDDMYVNVPVLIEYLSTAELVHRKDLIVGSLFCRAPPVKDLSSKWYSPQFMFSGKEYPDYVSGTGYVMSGSIVPTLFDHALQVPLFHLEDIFVTGMVARKANIVPENYHMFSYQKQALDKTCLYRKVITSHGLTPAEMRTVWQRVTNGTVDCSGVKLPKVGDPKMKKCKKSIKKVVPRYAAIRKSGPRV